jgi:hypothetical protein
MEPAAQVFLADALVALHAAFLLFVVGGQGLILAGLVRGWEWVRGVRFRVAHLAAICWVAALALMGWRCPLTVWERELRVAAGEEASERSFVARVARALLFPDLPDEAFRWLHVGFALCVLVTFVAAPPRRRRPDGGEPTPPESSSG